MKPAAKRREKPAPRPLDAARLDELALGYVARFGTTQAKLRTYLKRKLFERGWDGEGEPPVDALVERFAATGYVDDAAFARAKSGSLLRRGYGRRRVDQALGAAGVDETLRAEVAPAQTAQRRAALALARKRRLGPFGDPPIDRKAREKQVAAMLRAGHPLDSIRALLAAPTQADAEEWADAGGDDEEMLEDGE
jgi:regulatory protein